MSSPRRVPTAFAPIQATLLSARLAPLPCASMGISEDLILGDPHRAGQPNGVDRQANLGDEQRVVNELDPLTVADRASEHDRRRVAVKQRTHLRQRSLLASRPYGELAGGDVARVVRTAPRQAP
ncbi:MAG TPA: hypothetical protein VIL16_25960 [Trebonia sp.]